MASCPPLYAWADNFQHMNPCEVASSLMNLCDGNQPPLQPIDPGESYPRPAKYDSSYCQGGRVYSWSIWSANCASPSTGFPETLPANVSVPGWAYFDVNLDPIYSSAAASSSAEIPAFTTVTSASTTAIQTLPTPTDTFQTTPTDTTSTSTESNMTSLATASFGSDSSQLSSENVRHRTAAIVGGTVGAIVVLAIGVALAYWYMRRRARVPPSVAYMAVYGLEKW